MIVQQAVHAISDPKLLFERFEVHVGSLHLERFEQDQVDQLRDGGLVGDLQQIVGPGNRFGTGHFPISHVPDQILCAVGFPVIAALDGLENLRFRRKNGNHFLPQQQGQVVQDGNAGRIAGQHADAAGYPYGQHDIAPRPIDREFGQQRRIEQVFLDGQPEFHAKLLSQGGQHVIFRDPPLLRQD